MIEIPLIHRRLKAPLPTILLGPSSPDGSPKVFNYSITDKRISGADEPRAIKVKFAIVGFQTFSRYVYSFPSLSLTWTSVDYDVITSIASMKISAMIDIPKNK